jgi:hypothetical protein
VGSPVGAGVVPTGTTLTLSSRSKATPFRIILWRCWAAPEHGIARAKPRDPRLGEYSAISPIELRCQALAMWVPSLLRGYHEKASPSVQFASRVDLMPGFADRTVSSRAGRLATDNTIGIFDLCQPARPMPRPKENIVRSVPSANVGGGRCVSANGAVHLHLSASTGRGNEQQPALVGHQSDIEGADLPALMSEVARR